MSTCFRSLGICVCSSTGTLDSSAGGAVRPGGLVDNQGGHVPATTTLGSDYLIESVQFFDLPDVALTGVAAGGGG